MSRKPSTSFAAAALRADRSTSLAAAALRADRSTQACRAGALLVALTFSPLLHAQAGNAAAAQALFDQGKALMAAGKVSEACPKFAESQRLDAGLGTLMNLAACYEAAGQLASAWSTFLEAESVARAQGSAEGIKVSRERALALEPKLSKILLTLPAQSVDGLEIRRDGVVVGQPQWGVAVPADPGRHVVAASAPGREPWQTEIDLQGPGSTLEVQIPELRAVMSAPPPGPAAPAPVPAPPPGALETTRQGLGTQHYLAIGAGVVGLAGVVGGSIFGLHSKSKRDEADQHCDGGACRDREGVELREDARSVGNLSTIAFVVGGVAFAGGVVLWITAAPTPTEREAAGLEIGPGRVALRGTF